MVSFLILPKLKKLVTTVSQLLKILGPGRGEGYQEDNQKKNSMDLTDTSFFSSLRIQSDGKGKNGTGKRMTSGYQKKKESEQPLLQSKFQPTCSRTPSARSFSMGEGVRLHAGLK